jgi:tripartite-type tricarboxylate transporter receptor subunit TctC
MRCFCQQARAVAAEKGNAMKLGRRFALAIAAAAVLAYPVGAEPYPTRLITVVAPLAAGTTADIIGRLFADRLSKRLGQPVIVSNRPGAGGLVGAQTVAVSPPDGYTLLIANSGHTILGTLNKNLPFDPVSDFAAVTLIGESPAVVVVSPSLAAHSLKEFVDLARAKPGTINYASAGIGSSTHLAGAYFARKAGIDIVHVPYKSSADIITDLVSGRVQVVFAPTAFTLPMVREGKLRALAIAAKEPQQDPIAVPTAESAGVSYEYATWYGFLAPAKTPAGVLQTLNAAISDVAADPELKAKLLEQGVTPMHVGLQEFDAHIREDMHRLAPLLKSIGDQMGR